MVVVHKYKQKQNKLDIDTWSIKEIAFIAKPLKGKSKKVWREENWYTSGMKFHKFGTKPRSSY